MYREKAALVAGRGYIAKAKKQDKNKRLLLTMKKRPTASRKKKKPSVIKCLEHESIIVQIASFTHKFTVPYIFPSLSSVEAQRPKD